ncbi:MAG TPA: hypothetical protein VEB21_01360 [Terriglobales bacterium]|nr:hypothetical protein [Terriglobales bacterium]
MNNDSRPSAPVKALDARNAFVVHVTDADAGGLNGRVEHIPSGRSLRFSSTAELAEFMQTAWSAGSGAGESRG